MNIAMNSTIQRKAPPTVSFHDKHICSSSFRSRAKLDKWHVLKYKATQTADTNSQFGSSSSVSSTLFAARTISGGGVSVLSVKTSNLCFIMHYKDVTDLSL